MKQSIKQAAAMAGIIYGIAVVIVLVMVYS